MNSVMKRCMAIAMMCLLALAVGCSSTGTVTNGTQVPKLRVAPLDMTGSSGNFKSLKSTANATGVPRRLPVYRVVPANIDRVWFNTRANKLHLQGKVFEDDTRITIGDDAASFEVYKDSGSFDYTTEEFTQQTEPLKVILSPEEYRARAEAFLNDSGLMHPKAEFHDVNLGNVTAVYENNSWVERPYMVEVRFSHKPLGGLKFDQGVGPKIVVQFGENGAVTGAMSVWREVERHTEYTLLSLDEAVDEAARGKAQIFDVGVDAEGSVEDVLISYMNEPLGYKQEYVLPSYVMRGRASGRPFTAVVRAVPSSQLVIDESITGVKLRGPESVGPKK